MDGSFDCSAWDSAVESLSNPEALPAAAASLAAAPRFSEPKPKGRPKKNVLRSLPFVTATEKKPEPDPAVQSIVPAESKSHQQHELCFRLVEPESLSAFSMIQQQLLGSQRGHRPQIELNLDDSGEHDALAKFVNRCLMPSQPISSKKVIEQEIGGRSEGYHAAVASALVESGLCQWSMFLKRCQDMIASGHFRGVLFVKQRYYDETPLRLRSGKDGQNISKVLQSHFRLAVVLQNVDTKELVSFSGFVPTWLQTLHAKKAPNIMQAQMVFEQRVAFIDECSRQFQVSVQLVTTDRAGENFACETGINRLSPHFRKMHLPCDVHKTSTCINNIFKLTDQSVTGIVNMGLMFRPGGTLSLFHECIREEIRSKLKVVVGPPPGGYCQHYRYEVYTLFLGKNFSNKDVKEKQGLVRISQIQTLNYFLNGDIQSDDIVWYAPVDIELEDAIELLCAHLPRALLPGVAVFPRHRWHGCEIPIDQLGLLSAHHNLLKHACLRFLKKFPETPATKKAAAAVRVKENTQQGSGWDTAATLFLNHQLQPQPLQLESEPPANAIEDAGPEKQDDSKPPDSSWEEFNRSVRARVTSWILQDDLSILPLLRFACSPIIAFMFLCLKIASEAWQSEQEHAQLVDGTRKYRVLEAFLGQDLEKVFGEMSERLRRQIVALPLKAHNRRHCVLLFRLIARAASSLHFLLRRIRSGFPYKLFSCLVDKSADVLDSPKCLHDPVTKAFIEEFASREQGLDSPEAKSALHVLGELTLVDISAVESRHATVRRALEAASVQTWRANLEKLSADFSCRQSSGWRSHVSERVTQIKLQKSERLGRPSRATKKRRGGGGAWRTFCRDKLKNQGMSNNLALTLRAIAREYRALSPEQLKVYQDRGQAATLSHRKGFSAFGIRNRKGSGCKSGRSGQDAKHPPSAIVLAVNSLENQIQKKRKEHRSMRRTEKAKRQRLESDLRAHCRAGLGMAIQHEPVQEQEALDNTLSITSIPFPSNVQNACRIFPPNAKLTQASG